MCVRISSQGNLEVFVWQCLDFPEMQTDAGPLLTLKPPCEYNGKPQAFPLLVSSGACNWKALWIDRLHSMCSLSGQHSYWSEGDRLEMYQDQGGGTALAVHWLRLRTSNTGGAGTIPGQRTKIPLTPTDAPKKVFNRKKEKEQGEEWCPLLLIL